MTEKTCDTCALISTRTCSTCVDENNWMPREEPAAPCEKCTFKDNRPHENPCDLCCSHTTTGWPYFKPTQAEHDPHGTDAHAPGAKLDGGKVLAGVLADFALALMAVAEVGTHGAEKYSRGGWQSVPDGETRYRDAEWRHLLKGRHEDRDPDSGLLHAAHRAWNALAELELRLRREKGL